MLREVSGASFDRRRILQGLAAAGSSLLLPQFLRAASSADAKLLTEYPFRLGAASGFPTADSVVLWTRLAPSPLDEDGLGGMPPLEFTLRYELAADEQFRKVLQHGDVTASAMWAHSARVVVKGLQPARDYFYRFHIGAHMSPVGRARTLPTPNAEVNAFSMAVVSCAHFEHGRYAVYQHIARAAPELIMHLGDYIYEGAPTKDHVRLHAGGNCTTLAQYRQRYAQYQQDPQLQAAHLASPWITTWDDHEVSNDYAGLHGGRDEDPATFPARRAAAYQAYFEHLPLPPSATPVNGSVALYTRRQIGRLANLHMIDQRQYRSAEACPKPGRAGGNLIGPDCPELYAPDRTMLGGEQEAWLAEGLRPGPQGWNLLAQGTIVARMDQQPGKGELYFSDSWSGYPAARAKLTGTLQRQRTPNPVILSGDLHVFVAGHVTANEEQPDSPMVATEFVGTSITTDPQPLEKIATWGPENPHLALVESRYRGYVAARLTPRRLDVDFMAIDDPKDPEAAQRVLKAFTVESGTPKILDR